MILQTLSSALKAGFDAVFVVIGAHADEMRDVLKDLPVQIVENHSWEEGQSSSLSAGIRALPDDSECVCLLLGDQPWIRPETLRQLLKEAGAHPKEVIVPFYMKRRGNPIVVPASLYGTMLRLSQGDMGGRIFLEKNGYRSVTVDDPGVIRDVDTVEELEKMSDVNFWVIKNGEALPLDYGTTDISGTSRFTPIGAYTSFRTYDRHGVLRLTKHLDRLEETAKLAGFEVRLDRILLKKILTELINVSDPGEKRLRVTIDLEKEPGTVYVAMEKLSVPAPELYKNGIVCLTTEAHRDNPKAKLSNFLSRAEGLRGQQHQASDEILMVDDKGNLLEGLSSNFYGVIGNTVYTAEEGVLSGTTRDFILQLAKELAVPVVFEPVKTGQIKDLDEAFISSTSRSILPIHTIDGIPMKKNVPGPVTARLMAQFKAALQEGIESLR